jgi:hypothetical protein
MMRRIATILFASGVAVITYGITRWLTFQEFVAPNPNAGEGDPRFFVAFEHMLAAVVAGVITVSVSAYLFSLAKQKGGKSCG